METLGNEWFLFSFLSNIKCGYWISNYELELISMPSTLLCTLMLVCGSIQ
jgi:hypothetical protein